MRHCFVGGWKEALLRIKAFPNTYLSIGPKVASWRSPLMKECIHQDCRQVFANWPSHLLLTETNCGYMEFSNCGADRANTPNSVFRVLQYLTALRGSTDGKEWMKIIYDNARRFFQMD